MKILNKGKRKYSREETREILNFLIAMAKLQIEADLNSSRTNKFINLNK